MPDYSDVADRLEFIVWAENTPYSISTLKDALQALLASADAVEAQQLADDVFETLAERKAMLGPRYPFDVSSKLVSSLGTTISGTPYLFCLACSIVSHEVITPRVRDLMFEQLARSAAESYFGGVGIQTGAKWRQHGHKSYAEMIRKVGASISELGSPVRTVQPGGGDGGWDVILVKQFSDRLYPRIVVGGNCATGQTDWLKKGNETVFPHWFRHFFGKQPDGPYFEFFAAPFAADADQRSRKTGKETFLFDRFRLAEHGVAQPGMRDWLTKKALKQAAWVALL